MPNAPATPRPGSAPPSHARHKRHACRLLPKAPVERSAGASATPRDRQLEVGKVVAVRKDEYSTREGEDRIYMCVTAEAL